ncbi:hypothetical protein Ctha_0814 [Chloroherpeton thalassium ATCC 35110]|uniref:Uncharacterized protein n=1 Tax=Chloroherpeton thalassium (strain ATCC 35110 / GB-78) TaxID=517418 RepID=B3QWR8_CHLT3|nr:hypothetical protein Ctha_0814 [Chloroherpeton thalassium ATCC 35110]
MIFGEGFPNQLFLESKPALRSFYGRLMGFVENKYSAATLVFDFASNVIFLLFTPAKQREIFALEMSMPFSCKKSKAGSRLSLFSLLDSNDLHC